MADAEWQLHGEAHLAVEGHWVVEGVFYEHALVACGPGAEGDGVLVAEEVPELFADVWGEWCHEGEQRLEDGALVALGCGEVVDADHEGGYAGVEREALDVVADLLDGLVEDLEFGLGGFGVADAELVLVVVEEAPELLHEAEHAFDAVGVPRLGLLDGAEEHLVESECVGAVAGHEVVGVLHVEH